MGKRRRARRLDRLEGLLRKPLLETELVLALRTGHPRIRIEQQGITRRFRRRHHDRAS